MDIGQAVVAAEGRKVSLLWRFFIRMFIDIEFGLCGMVSHRPRHFIIRLFAIGLLRCPSPLVAQDMGMTILNQLDFGGLKGKERGFDLRGYDIRHLVNDIERIRKSLQLPKTGLPRAS